MKRCIRAVFLLCCVALLLAGARREKESSAEEPYVRAYFESSGFQSTDSHPVDFSRDYGQLYYDFLQEYISGREAGYEDEFTLLFIDDDDIPELLIFQDGTRGTKVFSCCEGQVAELGEYGYGLFGNMLFRERSGVVIDQFLGEGPSGGEHFYFYEIKSGTSNALCHLYSGGTFSEENGEYMPFYEIDGVPVPKDAFDAKWNELSDNHDRVFYEKSYSLEEREFLPTFTQAIEDIRSDLAIEQLMWKRDSGPVLEQIVRQEKVLSAYEKVLDELSQKWGDTGRFALIYLDGDDIPELAFIEGYAHIAPVNIYTYDQGEAVFVGYYGSEAVTAYWEKEGIIYNWYMSNGGVFGVHQVAGTEDTSLQVFNWEWDCLEDEGDIKTCYVDGLKVSEEYYKEAMQKWRDNASEKVLRLDTCTPIKDVDIKEALGEALQTLILSQCDTLKRNLLLKAGVEEDAILLMDYDDYDGDGTYEAFAFVGESQEYSGAIDYSGHFWFVGADRCMQLPNRHGDGFRMIDGLMLLGHSQKYLYYHSNFCITANISGIWTVENGKPVEVCLPQSGGVVYRGDPYGFELWVDSYNNYYHPKDDLWSGHTWRPYFYHYSLKAGRLEPDESENLSAEELKKLCGFDLAAEVEAEGYEVTAIVMWKPSRIVTINYTIPANEYGTITYENIIWDCQAKDYWRREERGVTSWRNAGEGGSI